MNETYGEAEQGVGVGVGGGGCGGKSHQEDDDNLVLWVGNLDSRTTENMVYELFCQAGPILHIRLPKNPDGQGHKGYSFVTFQHEASVPYAINVMEGTTLFGKKLKLQPRPGSVHRKLMDQKKASEQRLDNNFQGPQQGQPQVQQTPVPQHQQQQWFAHPQMAQVPPNMFVYQNQLYQSFTPNPNLNMNVMAIPFQPASAQMGTPFVQIPVQQTQTQNAMLPPQQAVRGGQNNYAAPPRMQNGYTNQYMSAMSPQPQQQQQQLRTASPQQQGTTPSQSHYNSPQQVNGQQGHQYHQPRGHYQNHRGSSRPQRNGGYANGSAPNNNSRMPYHQQQQQQHQRMPNGQQPYMINAYGQGQSVQLVQSPDFRRSNPAASQQQQQQQQTYPPGAGQGQTYPTASNGFHNVHLYHY